MKNTILVTTLKSELDNQIGNYGDRFCDYGSHHYICDVISYIADNNVDIYTYDLLKWIPNNYEWIEEAVSQGIVNTTNADNIIMRIAQAGQYEQISSDLYENLDAIILNYCYNYIMHDLKIEELTQEQIEAIEEKCTDVDNNDTLDMFEDFLTELLTKMKKLK